MGKYTNLAYGLAIAMLLALTTSCDKKADENVRPDQAAADTEMGLTAPTASDTTAATPELKATTNTTYSSAYPALGLYTVPPSNSFVGPCGSFQSNVLKTSVVSIRGNQIVFETARGIGNFQSAGTAYISAQNACGTLGGQTDYIAGAPSVRVTITGTFTSGNVNFVAKVLSRTGDRFYSLPVTISASTPTPPPAPTYNVQLLSSASAYRHFCQLNATACGSSICLADAYMIGRGIVYPSRAVSAAELDRIGRALGIVPTCRAGNITNLGTFVRTDICSSHSAVAAPTSQADFIAAVKSGLSARKPLVALARVNYNTTSTGHFYVIVGHNEAAGTFTVVNPLDRSATLNTVNVNTFCTSARSASSFGGHNYLRVGFGC